MATLSKNWTEDQTLRAAATIAAGATVTHDLNLAGKDRVLFHINAIAASGGDLDVRFLSSHDGGTTWDTVPLTAFTVLAGTTDLVSVPLISAPRYRVELTNNDGSNATGNVAVTYDWHDWTSA